MDELLSVLRAAAEPTRLRLLALCARGELTVSELTSILGQSQPRVSRHLKLLCDAGLLERFREGTHAFFRLSERSEAARLGRYLIESIPADDETALLDFERLDQIKLDRATAAATYFQTNAPQWDKVRSLYVDDGEVEAALLELVPTGAMDTLLDIGTGTGRVLELLAPRFERAFGVDMSRDMLAFARANIEAAHVPNATLRQGDMYKLPWPRSSFDVVTVHQVLHFAEEPAMVIDEASRVLSPDGILVLVDFMPHEIERLQVEHAHRWLGFADDEIAGWFAAAGLLPEASTNLPGDPLTVGLWSGRRAAVHQRQPSRESAAVPVVAE